MNFFIIGGAGYIGSHFVAEARRQGHHCVVYDDLSRGHAQSLPRDVILVKGDILDTMALKEALKKHSCDAIFHFAALALVGESVEHPDLYYRNNVTGVVSLVETMAALKMHVPLIFSSTCAVFGLPQKLPIAEDDPKNPISPYGRSKLMAEFVIEDYARKYQFPAMALRYFNACGADPDGGIGEDHQPETHLIPNILKAVKAGRPITIFGKDYNTRDGSCVRDYIHVTDLADAHIRAATWLVGQPGGTFEAVHVGTGHGFSNLEVVAAVRKVLGVDITVEYAPPRPGDPASLYADNGKAIKLMGFEPRHSELKEIIATAWRWHQEHPQGFS